ncbi:MAG: exonuclease SbcCD subunit D [Chloroflexi bacterium]|nr:exonuclease SbcCD subunit D [Chloroflexota bacterium]
MSATFLHAADAHLGYEQYNCPERYDDFARAFAHLVEEAIRQRVDALLLAGDLFHKRTIEPRTLLQASYYLQQLREAGIPVIAVEGNHDRPRFQGELSWLDYLAEIGLLTLLGPSIEGNRLTLDPWDPNTRQGAYIDLPCGLRIVGCPYYGASTPRVLREMAQPLLALRGQGGALFTVLLIHAGLQGILDEYAGTLTRQDLEPLRPSVDYVAMGHIHKPFVQDEWIYNPGSLETNSVDEASWEDRGYFLVEADASRQPAHRATPIRGKRRLFLRLSFAVDAFRSPVALEQAFLSFLESQTSEAIRRQRPVVELALRGVLAFDAASLELGRLEEHIREHFQAVYCHLRNLTAPTAFEISPTEEMSRTELEQYVLQELVSRDAQRQPQSERWASLLLDLKRLGLEERPPEEIIAHLEGALREIQPPEGGAEC